MVEYKKVETYRGWGIWQKDKQLDFVGNMKLEMSVKGVDKPDLKADIDENMRSTLAAFERVIKSGSKPRATSSVERRRLRLVEKKAQRRGRAK